MLAVKEKRWYPGLPYEMEVLWSIIWKDLGRKVSSGWTLRKPFMQET